MLTEEMLLLIKAQEIFNKFIPIETIEELTGFENAESFYIYEYTFYDNDKVKDRDHLTGEYRGAGHHDCNLNYKNPSILSVYIHNFKNFGVHLFIKELSYDTENNNVITNNEEKYISFRKE